MSSQQCSEDEKEVLVELIEALKVNRCLWDTKCEAYSNRDQRSVAHDLLLEIYRQIQPNATVDLLKKKVENLKCSFRREFRKVKASETTGAGSKQIHKPRLWFYDLMMFLEEKVVVRAGPDTLEENDNEVDDVKTVADPVIQEVRARREQRPNALDPPSTRTASLGRTPIQRKRKISALDKKKEATFDSVQSLISSKEPEWELIGKSIGLQLNQLNNEQQTIAHKLISDVIFYGKRQKLTDMSCINVDPTLSSHASSPYFFQTPVPPNPNMYDNHRYKHSRPNFSTQPYHTSPPPPAISPSTSSSYSESND